MKTILFTRHHQRYAMSLDILYRSLVILMLALLSSFTAGAADSCIVKLSVIDNANSETIPFANVVVYRQGVQVATATTDLDGACTIKNLAPGRYDFKAVYVGYMAQEVKGVEIVSAKPNWLNIKLKGGQSVITCCCFGNCYRDDTEDWWPKLWTPYREWYQEWKKKKEAKAAKQPAKKEIKLSEKPDETEDAENMAKRDSIESARIAIAEEPVAEILKIYPNPASDVLHVESNRALENITIIDESGKVIREHVMQNAATEIKLDGFANGVYYLTYVRDGKNESKKIVVVSQ